MTLTHAELQHISFALGGYDPPPELIVVVQKIRDDAVASVPGCHGACNLCCSNAPHNRGPIHDKACSPLPAVGHG